MLSNKQLEFLANCNHRWNIKTGATRSGKTHMDLSHTIPNRIDACRGEGLIVLLGNTKGTLERNILEPMRQLWGTRLVGQISSDNTVRLFGKKCYALGADNKKHVARIQGAAFEYCYGDEITTWSEDVFNMLKSRLSCEHSHFDGTCNPDSPHHWFKKFLDSDADIYCQDYTIDDNPFLPSAFVENLKREYAGTVYFLRFILGRWAAAEGVIYRPFADSVAAGDRRFCWDPSMELRVWRVHIGVDFGGSGSKHAFVATGILPNYTGVVALASQRVEPGDVDALVHDFLTFCQSVFAAWNRIDMVFCDSAEQTMIRQLRSAAARSSLPWLSDRICNAKKSAINDRIRLTSILMGGGRFWYLPAAESLAQALAAALWSGQHPGKDERLDDGTTDVDSLDAFEYTIERSSSYLLGLSI